MMKITKQYRTDDGEERWEIEIDADRYVTVRRSADTGNYYIMVNEDGSTVRDGAGKTYKNYVYDEYGPIRVIHEEGEKK